MAYPPLAYVDDGDWNAVRANTIATNQLLFPVFPQARVYNSANISLGTSGTSVTLTFDSERWDEGGLHSTSANTSRLRAPITGLYLIGAQVAFAANATGLREVDLRVNGSTFILIEDKLAVSGIITVVNATTTYRLAAGDYVEAIATQTSGGALNVTSNANYSPEFWMVRLGGYTNQGV